MTDDADQRAFRAGWLRVAFGVLGLVSFPLLGLELGPVLFALILYSTLATLQQLMLWKRWGGAARTWLGGLADVMMLTFIVHRVGATTTSMIALYIVIPLLFAMTGRHRAAMALGVVGSIAYTSVLVAESVGWLATAPDMPPWIQSRSGRPVIPAMAWAGIVSATTLLVTVVVVRLSRALAQREAELLAVNAELERMSQRDPLTRLYNRRHLMTRLDQQLERVRRGHPAALVMLDLDRFKSVNDDLGHLAGDDVLRAIARALERSTRKTDVAARYGGDEFAVLLDDASPDMAASIAERLTAEIRIAGRVDDAHQVTASVGVALARAEDEPKLLIQRADEHAYAAKQAGGDRAVGP